MTTKTVHTRYYPYGLLSLAFLAAIHVDLCSRVLTACTSQLGHLDDSLAEVQTLTISDPISLFHLDWHPTIINWQCPHKSETHPRAFHKPRRLAGSSALRQYTFQLLLVLGAHNEAQGKRQGHHQEGSQRQRRRCRHLHGIGEYCGHL